MVLEPLTEHELLVFWSQLLLLLFTARTLGALMRVVKQPTVIGELAAGVVLGPSVFGKALPDAWDWMFASPEMESSALLAVGWIGVFLLLIVTGFETDLALIRSLGRAAVLATVGSLIVPFAGGVGVGYLLPDTFLGAEADRIGFSLFIAASISISALAVMAKVLADLGLSRRNVGQLMLATGMANDAVGWLLLGAIAGIAHSGSLSLTQLARPLIGITIFLVFAFTAGQRFIDFMLRSLRRFDAGITGHLSVTVVIALAFGVATQWIGVEAVLGGFVAGVLLGRSKFQRPETRPHLEGITAAVFAPIFFATAGLRVDLAVLADAEVLLWTAIVTVVAFVAKLGGAYLGARRADLISREAIALGLGLNCRGTLEIVIATVGLTLGVFNQTSYTVVLVMVLITSTLAPPLLRMAVHNWPGTEEEQKRLEREETLSRNVLVKPERILLPSRGGVNSRIVARLIHLAWPAEMEATVLSVSRNGTRPDVDGVVAALAGRPVERKHVSSDDPVDAILKYAGFGYGVIGMGAVDRAEEGVISPLVDDLMAKSPLPMVIVRQARSGDATPPTTFRRILVPATGTVAARAAQEVAFNVAANLRAEAILVHVTKPGSGEDVTAAISGPARAGSGPASRRRGLRRLVRRHRDVDPVAALSDEAPAGARIVLSAQGRADKIGVDAHAVIREGTSIGDEIAAAARELNADLVFLGATMREVDGRPFMGHNIEHLLETLDATVVLVTTPRTTED